MSLKIPDEWCNLTRASAVVAASSSTNTSAAAIATGGGKNHVIRRNNKKETETKRMQNQSNNAIQQQKDGSQSNTTNQRKKRKIDTCNSSSSSSGAAAAAGSASMNDNNNKVETSLQSNKKQIGNAIEHVDINCNRDTKCKVGINEPQPASSSSRAGSTNDGNGVVRRRKNGCNMEKTLHSSSSFSVTKRLLKKSINVVASPLTTGGANNNVTNNNNSSELVSSSSSSSVILPPRSTEDACSNIIAAIQKCNSNSTNNRSKSASAATNRFLGDETTENNGNEGSLLKDIINIDNILSRVPYRDMLQDLFGSGEDIRAPSIPVVTRAYEESFMREPIWEHERPCVMGNNCECIFIGTKPGDGFIGVEFVLPGSNAYDEYDDGGGGSNNNGGNIQEQINIPQDRHMCVLCHRRLVQGLFYEMVYGGSVFYGLIQKYGNICNQEGEYSREVMLICPPNGPIQCMPLPSVSHQRNKYSIINKNGVKYIKQHNMLFQDFH